MKKINNKIKLYSISILISLIIISCENSNENSRNNNNDSTKLDSINNVSGKLLEDTSDSIIINVNDHNFLKKIKLNSVGTKGLYDLIKIEGEYLTYNHKYLDSLVFVDNIDGDKYLYYLNNNKIILLSKVLTSLPGYHAKSYSFLSKDTIHYYEYNSSVDYWNDEDDYGDWVDTIKIKYLIKKDKISLIYSDTLSQYVTVKDGKVTLIKD